MKLVVVTTEAMAVAVEAVMDTEVNREAVAAMKAEVAEEAAMIGATEEEAVVTEAVVEDTTEDMVAVMVDMEVVGVDTEAGDMVEVAGDTVVVAMEEVAEEDMVVELVVAEDVIRELTYVAYVVWDFVTPSKSRSYSSGS